MLAETSQTSAAAGGLTQDLHERASFVYAVLDFVAQQLPTWRDNPDRGPADAETVLTSQLIAHLNGAARHSSWDVLQFRTEEPDTAHRGRRIDIVAAPRGVVIWIDGRRHTEFDPILPIECKRLPTPQDSDRDEREYVIHRARSTGGIQRFKEGHHGSGHNVVGMIGYIQQGDGAQWRSRIVGWIDDLVTTQQPRWSSDDRLELNSPPQFVHRRGSLSAVDGA